MTSWPPPVPLLAWRSSGRSTETRTPRRYRRRTLRRARAPPLEGLATASSLRETARDLRRADTPTPTRHSVFSTHSDTQAVPAFHCLVAHDCGYPLSRYTCRATRVAADFLDFIAFCRCSTSVALHPLKILVSHLPPPVPGGVAPKFGSDKVSRYTGVWQLQLRVSRYTVQLSSTVYECLMALFRHDSVFRTHRHAVYYCLKGVQKPFRHASVFKTRVLTRACPFLKRAFSPIYACDSCPEDVFTTTL